ncbi:MAG: DUF3568 family protein [Deltaproteobacteria bacterium]|nr:DUF3568 family protein [Deltaproteobacteria bacterium]MBW2192258.1 DUF3568 family protein [Deltaproteobacteria bacterium]
MQKLLLFLSLSCYLVITGCAAVVAGAGAGGGIYAYMNGELKKSYRATFDRTVQASTESIKSLDMTIIEAQSDNRKTVINAEQTDGTLVTLKIEMITPETTLVSIRSGIIGIWEQKVSELIHARIAQQLKIEAYSTH